MNSPSTRTAQRARKAAGTSSPPGPAATLSDAKRVLIMLDAHSLAIADRSGPGTRSATIRAALGALVEIESWRTAGDPK